MVHVPLYVSDKFKGKSGVGLFGDVMMEVDWSVGQIMHTLRKLDIDKKTLFLFTSDNGPWLNYGDHAGSAAPSERKKVLCLMVDAENLHSLSGPGQYLQTPACKEPAMTIDILPTIAHLIGAKLPKHIVDGKNIWPLFVQDETKSPHEAYYFYYGNQLPGSSPRKMETSFFLIAELWREDRAERVEFPQIILKLKSSFHFST